MDIKDLTFIEKLTTNITEAMVNGIKSELSSLSRSIDKQSNSIEKLVANDIKKGEQLEEVKRHAFERIDTLEADFKKLEKDYQDFKSDTRVAEAVQDTRLGTWQKWWDTLIKAFIPIVLTSSFAGMIYFVTKEVLKNN
jgi:chromosome segregation ATPase